MNFKPLEGGGLMSESLSQLIRSNDWFLWKLYFKYDTKNHQNVVT